MSSLWAPRNIVSLDGLCYEASDSSISQNIFSYLKICSMQYRKNVRVEGKKKKTEYSYSYRINIFIQIYIYLYYMWREWLKIKMIQ